VKCSTCERPVYGRFKTCLACRMQERYELITSAAGLRSMRTSHPEADMESARPLRLSEGMEEGIPREMVEAEGGGLAA